MTTYLVDAHAWVEYFRGNKSAEPFRQLLMNTKNEFITAECNIAEVRLWALRANQDFDKMFSIIQSNSTLSPITLHDWLDAASVRQKMRKTRERFGLIDAILLIKQKELHCRILTGDPHFENLPMVTFLE